MAEAGFFVCAKLPTLRKSAETSQKSIQGGGGNFIWGKTYDWGLQLH